MGNHLICFGHGCNWLIIIIASVHLCQKPHLVAVVKDEHCICLHIQDMYRLSKLADMCLEDALRRAKITS